MMFKDGIQILGTIRDKVVFIPQNTQKRKHLEDEVAKLIVFCRANRITLKGNTSILLNLNKTELEKLTHRIAPIVGATMFDFDKEYGLEECLKTIAQYMRDYGNFDIPKSVYFDIANYVKPDATPKEFELVPVEYFYAELEKILRSPKNPDSYANSIIAMLEDALPYDFGKVINKQILTTILKINNLNRFKPINAAQLRIFSQAISKFKTSHKTFIMRELSNMPESDVLDEFATHRGEWLQIEKRIIPTQFRYRNYIAQKYFHRLRDRDFSDSNNSQVEKIFAGNACAPEKFRLLCKLKSPQFAIRSLSRIVKKESEANDALGFEIARSNPRLKQLIEAYNGLGIHTPTKVSKIKDKFWTRNVKIGSYERNNAIRDLLLVLIQNSILSKTQEYCRLTSDASTPEFRKYVESQSKNRTVRALDLKNFALPLNTEGFYDFEKIPVAGRGSRIDLSAIGDEYCVFVAWKSKDGKEVHQDIDLSCNIVENGVCNGAVNYTHLESLGLKHSGDFTSTIEFKPKEGLVVAEMIRVNRTKQPADLHFTINTFNGLSLAKFDVYVGIAKREALTSRDKRKYFKLDDAVYKFKISGDITGYYKLFTITGNSLLLEGTIASAANFMSSGVAARGCIQSQEYCRNLGDFSVLDFITSYQGQDCVENLIVNIDDLKNKIDFAINS